MKGLAVSSSPAGNEWLPKGVANQTAAGTTQGTAYVIPAGQDLTIFSTVGSGTGAVLPSSGPGAYEEYMVANHGVNALLVYPGSGGKMGTASVNAGYSLPAGKTGYFTYVGLQNWTVNP